MSRCYPYPPPGYTANNEALIESIKLQREREIAKAEKKEKKREKKEKKREKKAKEATSNSGFDKAAQESKGKYLYKCLEDEAEQLERSNLTEEHGQAVCSQNSSCSSDSTQNSNKRKRPALPSQGGIQAHGSIIRIRLSKKGGQGETSTSQQKELPTPAQQDSEVTVRRTVVVEKARPLLKIANKQVCVSVSDPSPSTSGRTDPFTVDKAAVASCSKVHENSIECQYKNLIEMLPPSLPSEHLDFDDQSWLFQRKPKQARVELKHAVSNDTICGSFALWPKAQYIQDADLYALPYTIPF